MQGPPPTKARTNAIVTESLSKAKPGIWNPKIQYVQYEIDVSNQNQVPGFSLPTLQCVGMPATIMLTKLRIWNLEP